MKHNPLITPLTTLAALLSTGAAHAHEGHGLPGISHWHSTDVLGFIVVAALVAGVIWFKGRK